MKKSSTYIAFAIALLVMALVYPKQNRFGYVYSTGSTWQYETLVADIDFPILKTYDEIFKEKEAKASDVVDCYLYREDFEDIVLNRIEQKLDTDEKSRAISAIVCRNLKYFYDAGIMATPESGTSEGKTDVILVKRGKRVTEEPFQNIFILSNVIELLEDAIADSADGDDKAVYLSRLDLKNTVVPNLLYDAETTALFHKEAVDYVSPTKGMFYTGQLIVSKGELITQDIQQLLDSYKAEMETVFGNRSDNWKALLGHILNSLIILALLYTVIFLGDRSVFEDIKKLSLVLTLFLIAFLSLEACLKIDSKYLLVIPFAALAAIMSSFFKRSFTLLVYIVMLLPVAFVSEMGLTVFFCNLVAGCVIMVTSEWLNRGWIQFLNAVFIYAAMITVILTICLTVKYIEWPTVRFGMLMLAINSILVVVCYPFMYLFEKIFSQISYSHLWLLSDTNNKLLTRMSHLAPGTFQHSLQVANITEAAVKEIGGNYMLAKVGALYHDIGKLDNPLCFVENQMPGAENEYHKSLKPEESAHDIIKHVEDGISIARKEPLPVEVTDFIRTHHGNTRAAYFYAQYCNAGGDPENVVPFTYSSGLPQTKEQAVLMVADSVEAASRTLGNYSRESISDLVENIIGEKLSSHQFDEADISMKEIGIVKDSIKNYLMQIYHARISYPKRRKQ